MFLNAGGFLSACAKLIECRFCSIIVVSQFAKTREVLALNIKKYTENRWITALLLVLSATGIGLLSLCFATTQNRWEMMECYFKRPLIILLNILPCVLLCMFIWLLCSRAVVAYGVTAVTVFGLSLASWYKLQFRNDPLMFGDLFLVQEAGNMLGNYSLFMTPSLAAALCIIVLGGVFIFFFARGRLRLSWQRFAAAGIVLLLCFPISRLYTSSAIYNNKTQNFDIINRWNTTQVYTSKGFVYPFLHSVVSAFDKAPEGYNKGDAEAALSQYETAAIADEKKVDVIAVMLEAFNDFSKYEQIEFAQDVYADYHALEAEAVSGNLITNIFAGGTVTSERGFITGLVKHSSFRSSTNSYAWYFAEQGYTVTGSHPCYQWFYNRLNINPNLGFENYLFQENHYGELAGETIIAKDDIFFPELRRLYNEDKTNADKPYFSFSVTYQGHGPYGTEENRWGEDFVKPGTYTAETENILNNYLGSVKSTASELKAFVDSYRTAEEPVVIVLFGDHNPWLGDDNSVYKELGIDLDTSKKDGFYNYYGTRYLIWANDAAKKVLDGSFTGAGPDISPNFLMNELFNLCGWQGDSYMQFSSSVMDELPVIHSSGACITADGEFVAAPDGEIKKLLETYENVEYYQRTNFKYDDILHHEKSDAAEKNTALTNRRCFYFSGYISFSSSVRWQAQNLVPNFLSCGRSTLQMSMQNGQRV